MRKEDMIRTALFLGGLSVGVIVGPYITKSMQEMGFATWLPYGLRPRPLPIDPGASTIGSVVLY